MGLRARQWLRTHFVLLARLPASLLEVLTGISVIRSSEHKKTHGQYWSDIHNASMAQMHHVCYNISTLAH